ncbi:hypothetical protein Dxin01_02701 [Deinococcus xinjiangensis]|uniref:Uncharacterized protein n=1 Tax=Deinococcus xinjiangensis TaxID=457454 RepID=A0ABP9VCI1_9DEIO
MLFIQLMAHGVTARRSLTVEVHQLPVKPTIPVGRVFKGNVIHLFTVTLLNVSSG